MGTIQKLPAHVVNQIAAGEVIERPASVVKELLENTLDAGASRVEVSIHDGGRELIRVWDNGVGIAAEDLPMAVTPHATSKLTIADDLFRVATFGFRGEALASIASVSHLSVQSRARGELSGNELRVEGGVSDKVSACGCPEGTAVEVRNLFFNIPVRRKFLKTTQTEMGHITEAFTRIALARPDVALSLRHNDRTLFDLAATGETGARIREFFGGSIADHLIEVESILPGKRLHGFVVDPTQSRSTAKNQYLFINGRFIRDKSLSHALSEAYRGLLMVGRYPIAFLFLEISPEDVDVNVHPTKIEVRFREAKGLYSQLLGTIRERFLQTDLTARLQPPAPDSETGDREERIRAEINEFFQQSEPGSGPAPQPPYRSNTAASGGQPWQLHPIPDQPANPLAFQPPVTPTSPTAQQAAAQGEPQPARAIQLHHSYLVIETRDGMMIVDQHALHERILYEQLKKRILDGALEVQRLLVPDTIDLSAGEMDLVLGHQQLLLELGIEVDRFGAATLSIQTVPALLGKAAPHTFMKDLVDILSDGTHQPNRQELLDNLMASMSCKAAVKAGQRLSAEEISALAEQKELARDTHHCPHGRPTALIFTLSELERQFKRT